ncbi:MAG: CHAD domain-containing protein [Thiotrichaceae bacterium]
MCTCLDGYAMLRKELRWLGDESGMKRGIGTYFLKLSTKYAKQITISNELDALVVTVHYFQVQSYQKMREILRSSRYHRLLLLLGKWLTQQDESEISEARWEEPIAKLADDILQRRYRFVREQGENLLELSAESRHAVRIEIKKLNYAIRFFISLYPSEAIQDYLNILSKLQTELGILNDISVAHTLLDRAGLHPLSPARHLLMGWYAYQRVMHLKKIRENLVNG